MSVSGYTRVLVHLRKTPRDSYQPAVFAECVLKALGLSGEGQVECYLQDNKLLLTCPTSDIDAHMTPSYKLMHPPFCPSYQLAEAGRKMDVSENSGRGVGVGVVMLLESADGKLLLTRRAPHMNTFPNVWVPPGGHIEAGESLEAAGLRELEEETGLRITEDERHTCHILGLWESVYPPVLAMGDPKRQHIVVYLHVILKRSSEELQSQLKLCPNEVAAAVWLTDDLVQLSVWDDMPWPESVSNTLIPITLVNQDGEHVGGTFEASLLKNSKDPSDLGTERLSTGSRYALSLWLEQQKCSGNVKGANIQDLYGKYMQKKDSEKDSKSKM